MKTVFIDGSAGTTGLRIHERLGVREDIELVTLTGDKRKDPESRAEAIDSSDVSFLCLPDDAAREAIAISKSPDVTIIDTSTAHRTEAGWAYGLPELSAEHREKIRTSKRIAVPGCHASGFIVLVYPLIKAGIIHKDELLTCHSLTGYSGGGKKTIAAYAEKDRDPLFGAPRQYGITQQHKHLKEMKAVTGIDNAPVFCPIIADFYSGMEVTVPLFRQQLADGYSVDDIKALYSETYTTDIIRYVEGDDENGFMSALALSGKDSMRVSVEGNEDRILLIARYDNLGKGASGAAVQCLNISLGVDETTGLDL